MSSYFLKKTYYSFLSIIHFNPFTFKTCSNKSHLAEAPKDMQPRIDDSSPSAAARTPTSSSSRSSWAENEGSASGSDSLLTSSTASLLPPQDNNRRLGPGPGLLIFPGTGQRHQHNPNGSTGSKTIAKANDGNAAINQPGPARSIRSFRRPPLWQPPPQDHTQDGQEMEVLDRQKRKDCRPACLVKGQAFIIEFLQGSSIHGFIYLAKLGLSFVER